MNEIEAAYFYNDFSLLFAEVAGEEGVEILTCDTVLDSL